MSNAYPCSFGDPNGIRVQLERGDTEHFASVWIGSAPFHDDDPDEPLQFGIDDMKVMRDALTMAIEQVEKLDK